MPREARSHWGILVATTLLAACGSGPAPVRAPAATGTHAALPEGGPGPIEVKHLDGRPRLTLVTREGDPSPAIAAVFATGAGSATTVALAAVVEVRLRAAGLDADVRADRDAFRARFLTDAAHAPAILAALASAMARPIAAGSPEIALAAQRLQSLKRNPLDAPELAAASACTGALGIAPGEAIPDLSTEAGLAGLEGARRAVLHAGDVAIAAVGPAAFGAAITQALARSEGWPTSAAAPLPVPWPDADTAGVYTLPAVDPRAPGGVGPLERVTLAVLAGDPVAAAAAAERLGAPDSPLVARLRLLPEAWRVTQVAGVARARGGCVALTMEATQHGTGPMPEEGAALAAATARREVAAEIFGARGASAAVVATQILRAADPREAAARAAWWSLSSADPAAPARWTAALGIPPVRDREGAEAAAGAPGDARFHAEVVHALASSAGTENRAAIERGQGELWLLLASPCGVAEETAADAGRSALAVLAAVESRRLAEGVALEPWITPDGIGVLAHAPARDERETPNELARRVADAAARTLTAASPSPEAAAAARASALEAIERRLGPQGTAFAAFAAAISPGHPSWVDPFGLWSPVAGAGAEALRLRALALAQGPLRLAVIANADAAQAAAANDAVDRWLAPLASARTCHAGSPSAPRPGHHEAKLPSSAPLAQGLVGVPVPPPGAPGRDLAEITAAALEGMLTSALRDADATASARLVGGARAPALVVDVRASDGGLASALDTVKALLLRLPTAATDADLARAAAAVTRREREARADPRRRLVDLWSGRPPPAAPPSPAAWRSFLGATFTESALVVVEGRL